MSYQVITDFRGGLDARKFKLTQPPGTVTKLVNGHITAGAEIEKRKAFVFQTNPGGGNSLPAGTLGMQETSSGIYVFGSADLSASQWPTNFKYQRLQHPAVLAGTAYSAGSHAMTAVVHSDVFGDYPFVVATFADGYTFGYYNGRPVTDFFAGEILPYMNTAAKISGALVNLVNNTLSYNATLDGSGFDVTSSPGSSWNCGLVVLSISNISVTTGSATDYQNATVASTTGANAPNTSTLYIGGKLYTFVTALSSSEGQVLIGNTIQDTLLNLYNAINHTGTPNTDYYCAAQNANVYAQEMVSGGKLPYFTITARVKNTATLVANTIEGATFTQESGAVNKAVGTQAQGQFQITAGIIGAGVQATGTVTNNGTAPADGSKVTIAGQVYQFKTTPAAAYDVKIVAGNANSTMDNLILAINATGTPGTNYFAGTLANPNVSAGARATATFTVSARVAGSAGNAIAMASTSGTTNLTLAATLTGGSGNGIVSVTVGPVAAYGTITTNGTNPSDGDQLTIGSKTFRFKNTLASEGDIHIGASALITLRNLMQAINQSGVPNYDYKVGGLNPEVKALPSLNGNVLTLIAWTPGTAGNSLGLSQPVGTTFTVSGATMTGGADTINLFTGPVFFTAGTTNTLAIAVAAAINNNTGTSGFSADVNNDIVLLYSANPNSYANLATVTVTSTGQICVGFCAWQISQAQATPNAGIVGLTMNGASIINQTTTWGSTYYTIVVNSVSNLVKVTAAIVNDPANTSNNGVFCAVPVGANLYLAKVVASSADVPLAAVIQVGNSSLAASELSPSGLVAVVTPNYLTMPNNGYSITYQPAVCKVSGGYPPYTYKWQYDHDDASFSALSPASYTTFFARVDTGGGQGTYWNCLVSDSKGNNIKSNLVNIYQP